MSEQTFRYKDRIKKKREISHLLYTAKRWECSCFVIFYSKNNIENDRFAILVSRKLGNAVKRNKIKRKFRELFRRTKINNLPFYDILIKPRSGNQTYTYATLEEYYRTWQMQNRL